MNAKSKGVEFCKDCPMCKFTRSREKDDWLYRTARFIQKRCPACNSANKRLGTDYQKSLNFDEGKEQV